MNTYITRGQGLILLSGKIVVCELPSTQGNCFLYNNNNKTEFRLPNTTKKQYSGLRWLNNKDILITVEKHKAPNRKTTHSNLVLLDTLGNVIRRVVNSNEGQYVGFAYPSPNDSLLFFTTEVETKKAGGIFERQITINIINIKDQTIVKQISNFCKNVNFDMAESPWSTDENRFVYSIVYKNINTEKILRVLDVHPKKGIYIYNIKEDNHIKIAEEGYSAVWSPRGDSISFIKNNKVWLYNVISKETELLYAAEKHEQIKKIHWTPDGNYLYIVCPKYYGNNFNMKHNEKLIRIIDKKEIEFVKPNICLNSFTWKGDSTN